MSLPLLQRNVHFRIATAKVFRRQGESFLPPLLLSAESDDPLITPLLLGLEISLREVFAP